MAHLDFSQGFVQTGGPGMGRGGGGPPPPANRPPPANAGGQRPPAGGGRGNNSPLPPPPPPPPGPPHQMPGPPGPPHQPPPHQPLPPQHLPPPFNPAAGHPQNMPPPPPNHLIPPQLLRRPTVEVSDLRRMSPQDYMDLETTYVVYRLEKVPTDQTIDALGKKGKPTWSVVYRTKVEDANRAQVLKTIKELIRDGPGVMHKKAELKPHQKSQIETAREVILSESPQDPRYEVVLVELDSEFRLITDSEYDDWLVKEHRKVCRECRECRECKHDKHHHYHHHSRHHHHGHTTRKVVVSSSRVGVERKRREKRKRVSITAYFKRCPRSVADAQAIFEEREYHRRMAMHPPPMNLPPGQQFHPHPQGPPQGVHQGPPQGPPPQGPPPQGPPPHPHPQQPQGPQVVKQGPSKNVQGQQRRPPPRGRAPYNNLSDESSTSDDDSFWSDDRESRSSATSDSSDRGRPRDRDRGRDHDRPRSRDFLKKRHHKPQDFGRSVSRVHTRDAPGRLPPSHPAQHLPPAQPAPPIIVHQLPLAPAPAPAPLRPSASEFEEAYLLGKAKGRIEGELNARLSEETIASTGTRPPPIYYAGTTGSTPLSSSPSVSPARERLPRTYLPRTRPTGPPPPVPMPPTPRLSQPARPVPLATPLGHRPPPDSYDEYEDEQNRRRLEQLRMDDNIEREKLQRRAEQAEARTSGAYPPQPRQPYYPPSGPPAPQQPGRRSFPAPAPAPYVDPRTTHAMNHMGDHNYHNNNDRYAHHHRRPDSYQSTEPSILTSTDATTDDDATYHSDNPLAPPRVRPPMPPTLGIRPPRGDRPAGPYYPHH